MRSPRRRYNKKKKNPQKTKKPNTKETKPSFCTPEKHLFSRLKCCRCPDRRCSSDIAIRAVVCISRLRVASTSAPRRSTIASRFVPFCFPFRLSAHPSQRARFVRFVFPVFLPSTHTHTHVHPPTHPHTHIRRARCFILSRPSLSLLPPDAHPG